MTIEDDAYEEAEDLADQIGVAIEFALLGVIASRLGKITPETTIADTVLFETSDFAKMDDILKRGRKAVERASNISLDKLDKINQEWAEPYFNARKALPPASSVISDAKKIIASSSQKLIRTSVIGIVDDHGKTVQIARGYRKAVSNAVSMMKIGEEAYQTAIAHTVKQLSTFGARVQYQRGYQRELYASVRTNIMDAYSDAMELQREEMGHAFGADGVEVTAHLICATDHQPYQGQRYSYERRDGYDLWSDIQFQPDRPLVEGANCRHRAIPVILGVGKPAYTERELANMHGYSNGIIEVNGLSGKTLHMTRYEATQYQRNMEREIRRSKGEARLLDDANLPNFAKMANNRARRLTEHYKVMSELAGLTTRIERTRLYKL